MQRHKKSERFARCETLGFVLLIQFFLPVGKQIGILLVVSQSNMA
jgi:hypothetical protein